MNLSLIRTSVIAFALLLSIGSIARAELVSFTFDIENFGGTPGDVVDQGFNLGEVISIDSVSIDLSHSFAADIDFTLQAPDGQTFNFTSDLGGNRDLGDGGSLLAGTENYTFVEFASEDLGQAAGNPISGGTYQALEWGIGAWAPGNWQLILTDDASGDLGAVGSVAISFTGPAVPEPSALFVVAGVMGLLGLRRRR